MLSRQSASRPRLAAHRRNRRQDRLPPEDGHARGAKAVSPTQPRDRVLPRLDQKQTGTAPVPPARLGQSANGNALGLPHLQSATVDPPAQAASRTQRRLKPLRQNKNPTQTSAMPDPPDHGKINASRFFVVAGKVFFTASKYARNGAPHPASQQYVYTTASVLFTVPQPNTLRPTHRTTLHPTAAPRQSVPSHNTTAGK